MSYFKGRVNRHLNVRIDRPSVRSEKREVLIPGTEVSIKNSIRGDKHRGSDLWYTLADGAKVWSGAIDTLEDISEVTKKILVTADDVGIVDAIDTGAIVLLKEGLINSIAVFVNQDKNNPRHMKVLETLMANLEKYQRPESRENLMETTHIGLHFTVTSGKPLHNPTRTNPLTVNGFFRDFCKINKKYKRDNYKEHIKEELQKQYDEFKSIFGRNPDHLTCHHDVLTYSEDLFHHMLDFSTKNNVLIRSSRFLSEDKRELFNDLAVPLLDLPSEKQMSAWLKKYESNNPKIRVPDFRMVDHYSPPPPFKITRYQAQINKKQKCLKKWTEHFLNKDDRVREILIHQMLYHTTDYDQIQEDFSYLDREYKGINTKYYDGRIAEYFSLRQKIYWGKGTAIEYLERGEL